MKQCVNFVPPKPISEPFGPGSGNANTFHVGRDGVLSIEETETGSFIIIREQAPGGARRGFLFTAAGAYARLHDSEVEQPPPKKEKADK